MITYYTHFHTTWTAKRKPHPKYGDLLPNQQSLSNDTLSNYIEQYTIYVITTEIAQTPLDYKKLV